MSLDLSNCVNNNVILKDICRDIASGNWNKYWASNAVLIRPSGNPLSLEENNEMRSNKDIVIKKEELIEINFIKIYGDVANICMTIHQEFTYKGVDNNDISVVLLFFKKDESGWKMISGSRSSGRGINDPLPKFN